MTALTAVSFRPLAPPASQSPRIMVQPCRTFPVIVVVESLQEAEFLRRLSAKLHQDAPSVANLGDLERRHRIVFLPTGRHQAAEWAHRLEPLGCPTWLNDHQSDVFVVCTANDVSKLPPEFTRAERFDGNFFLDLPTTEQKESIWQIYSAYFSLDLEQARPQ